MKLILVLLSVLTPVYCEDLYIAQATAGSADGSTCANALAYTFFNSSGNWGSGTGKISAGDTVHVCGTVTNKILFQANGTSGNPITLKFETGAKFSAATWGTGTTGEAISFQGGAAGAYLIIDGGVNGTIECTDNGSSPTYANQDDTGGVYFVQCDHCEIKNLTVSNIFVKDTTDSQGGGDAIHISEGSNNSIHHNTVHDSNLCITHDFAGGSTSTSISIYNNTAYHCNWGVKVSPRGASGILTGLLIYGNNIYDAVNWDDLSGNQFHHNGVIIYTTFASSDVQAPLIYNNYIHGDMGAKETGHIFLDQEDGQISNAVIFNNLLINDNLVNTPANGLIITKMIGTASTTYVYNNVILFLTANKGRCVMDQGATLTGKNNIFVGCLLVYYLSSGSVSVSDYNDVYLPDGSDVSEGVHSITSNPDLNSTYHPNSGSPVIAAGEDLSGLGITALNSDAAGVTRGSAWDIGAYEFVPPPAGITRSGPISMKGVSIQ